MQAKFARFTLFFLVISAFIFLYFCNTFQPIYSGEEPLFSVLLFTKTAGFRHSSIADGVATVTALGESHHFQVTHSEDATLFNDATLANFQVVIFLNTTGDILNNTQQVAFERFVQNGGGFVGVHSATDTEYGWAWYGDLVGAYFDGHPAIQQATVNVEDSTHRSTQFLPTPWVRNDEWYNFRDGPDDGLTILLTVDETTYSGGTMGSSHPIAWYHDYDGGRAWYTGMGHTNESYGDSCFQQHLLGGIFYAAGYGDLSEKVFVPLVVKSP